MKNCFRFAFLLTASLFITLPVRAESLHDWALQAAAPDSAAAPPAIAALRAAGPAGMQALSDAYAPNVQSFKAGREESARSGGRPAWWRVQAAFDAVGLQRDNYLSQLYWFTDLPTAEAAAKEAGKPILSLRLLGKLSDEYSCANSRFFRTTLYANAEVAAYLRAHFILHWQSERPVPRITIDMGDGRKIERTITGNSIHYILDAEGRLIDALPGLYSAKAFLAGLQRAENAERSVRVVGEQRGEWLRTYHQEEGARLASEFSRDLAKVRTVLVPWNLARMGKNPTALQASSRASVKSAIEIPLLRLGVLPAATPKRADVNSVSSEDWSALAKIQAADVQLDPQTRRLIAEKQPDLAPAMELTVSKMAVETPMSRMLRNLTASIAEDTLRNEYGLHARIHEWLTQEPSPALEALNRRVYAELFLTPDSDPWLGLAPADTFSALERGGLVQPTVPR